MPGTVPITLDRERNLRLDINALAEADDLLGEKILDLLTGRSFGIAACRGLLWAGLKHEDPKLTLDAAGDLMQTYLDNGGDFQTIIQKIRQTFEASGLVRGAEKNGQPEAPKGSASGNG